MTYRYQSQCGKARLVRSIIHTEQTKNGSTHTVDFEVQTLTYAQAEALQVAFFGWLAALAFEAK